MNFDARIAEMTDKGAGRRQTLAMLDITTKCNSSSKIIPLCTDGKANACQDTRKRYIQHFIVQVGRLYM